MTAPQLLFVTGKGGVGKTTVAAALGQALAARRRRVLVVETAADASLARLCGAPTFAAEPAAVSGRLYGVRLDTRALVESYFRRLLKLPFLSRRLFASATFHAVTAAAPGVTEFVVLDHLAHWTEAGRFSRAPYDVVIVDGPASGHALRLLRTPRQLASLVPRGPLANAVGRLQALLDDGARTRVVLVAIPDEMAITETLEAQAALAGPIGMHCSRPVLNRVWPRRFTNAEAAELTVRAAAIAPPLREAAHLSIAARREADRHLRRLTRAFGRAPVALHELCTSAPDGDALVRMGRTLARGLEGDGA